MNRSNPIDCLCFGATVSRIVLILTLFLVGFAQARSAAVHVSENRIWGFLNSAYDEELHADVGYDAPGKLSLAYDVASSRARADNERRTEAQRASQASSGRLLAARGTPNLKTVTSWANEGITPDLNPGRWVQVGEATKPNFWKTGLPGPKLTLNPLKLEGSKVPFSHSVTG